MLKKQDFHHLQLLNYSKTENKDLSATVDEDEQETVKATVTWPIIQGGKNFSSIKKFKHKKEKTFYY